MVFKNGVLGDEYKLLNMDGSGSFLLSGNTLERLTEKLNNLMFEDNGGRVYRATEYSLELVKTQTQEVM